MKLVVICETPISTLAFFSLGEENLFVEYHKTIDLYNIRDISGYYLDFSQEECHDVLVELKKQDNFRKEE